MAIWYLFQNRPAWGSGVAVGKTLVSSAMIDRVAGQLGRRLYEVPVGFKYFVDGLLDGSLGFGGEESAGASFLRQDGTVWTTDKDGIILDLLAAEITATTGRDPGEHYRALESRFGSPVYERMDVPANELQRAVLANLSPDLIQATELAGEKIIARLTHAPGNNAAHRRVEGDHGKRLVRGQAVRDGRYLQGLCRELPKRGASPADPGRGSGDRGRRVPSGRIVRRPGRLHATNSTH